MSPDPDILTPKPSDDTNYLSHAVAWFEKHKIPLYGININPTQASWTDSPKVYAHYYIDDIALGSFIMSDPKISDRPFMDWAHVRLNLEAKNLL